MKTPLVILTGCILGFDRKKFKNKVDLILDINNLSKWPELITKSRKHKNIKTLKQVNDNYFSITPTHQSLITAYVPIMTGCNNFCSYCVVPYTRGHERSRLIKDILNEIGSLIKKDYKEIILIGQNVNSYKSEFKISNLQRKVAWQPHCFTQFLISKNNIINFPQLLRIINKIQGNFWIRFLTSHPKDLSDELIKTMIECEKVTEYLHLPIQSGSNRILKRMNRNYTVEHYINLIKKIRKQFALICRPISLFTDIIVGFPNETKKNFEQTVKIMKQAKFDMAYIAQYSPRAGTAAFDLKDDVPKIEKKRRERVLTEILKKTALENNKKFVGKIVEVLVDKRDSHNIRSNSHRYSCVYGKTRTFKNVKINTYPQLLNASSLRDLIGQFVKVKITKAGIWGLEGRLLNKNSQ